MTPKEKANELVYKYQNLVTSWNCYWDTEIPIEDRMPQMKECALFIVNEIMELGLLYGDAPFGDGGKQFYSYWQEVKKEINKK